MDNAPVKEGLFGSVASLITSQQWIIWLTNLVKFITIAPEISNGMSAPESTPSKIGNIYCDTENDKVYVSTGTSSSSDWKVLN